MTLPDHRRRALLSWAFVCALFSLCGVLAILQYRWIGEISVAARERLRGSLQATLFRLNQGLNSELATNLAGLLPPGGLSDPKTIQPDLVVRFDEWKTTHDRRMIRSLALALPRKDGLELFQLDLDRSVLQKSAWPTDWSGIKKRLEADFAAHVQWDVRHPPGPPLDSRFAPTVEEYTMELSMFVPSSAPWGRSEAGWEILDLNPVYLHDVVLPEAVQRYLGAGGSLDYQVEIVTKAAPRTVIYKSDPSLASIIARADTESGIFDPMQFLSGNSSRGAGRGGPPDAGRWQIFVRHRAGSLEAVVAQTRWRNLAIAAGVLLLIVATATALIRYTRRTQKLAELQMDFVAGVSHELRTPLTVIHTAAYNLQGKMAHDFTQVERYGKLIQRESGRLNNMVEQILRFAIAESGRVIEDREPVAVESVIEEAVSASKLLIDGTACEFKKQVAPGLPLVMGDRVALRQALENLITNALKYGLRGGNWIGVSAAKVSGHPSSVEIRVADHGPGIPRDEQDLIFDPFFRGARAQEEQIRGTGLGLSLVKRIVEAHGGNIRVESDPFQGTVFILRLPAEENGVPA
jgi:signal transduction histidine kinase